MSRPARIPDDQDALAQDGETFSAAISERGQVVIPIALRKRVGLATGDELVWWVNAQGHLEAEPARAVRARAHKVLLAEARAIAEETADQWPDESAAQIVGENRR